MSTIAEIFNDHAGREQADFTMTRTFPRKEEVEVRGRMLGREYGVLVNVRLEEARVFDPRSDNDEPLVRSGPMPVPAKVSLVLADDAAMKNIVGVCLGKGCDAFSWSGLEGPLCRDTGDRGCSCSKYVNPGWKCPRGLF